MGLNLDISQEEAVQAVATRNVAYDGRLFYAVITTGIYCRPSCHSRAAKSENLRFFNNATLAEAAGYRACKRCKPEQCLVGESNDEHSMIAVARFIESHSDSVITLASLSKQFGLSSAHLQKSFKQVFGLSPRVFQDGIRQQRFKSLLRHGESVTDALYAVGYGSSSRVYESADKQLGMTPGAYKSGAKNEAISYACAKTGYGYLMLAATNKGVCFAMFDKRQKQLLSLLQNEFPAACISRSPGNEQLDIWYAEIERYLLAEQSMPVIPLDLRGSAFQMRVWRFLQSTGPGDVLSYRDVAEGIEQPSAVRAAATACGKNRVALLVPCHRVLRSDGGIGGYRWGVRVKQDLLALEKEPQ